MTNGGLYDSMRLGTSAWLRLRRPGSHYSNYSGRAAKHFERVHIETMLYLIRDLFQFLTIDNRLNQRITY